MTAENWDVLTSGAHQATIAGLPVVIRPVTSIRADRKVTVWYGMVGGRNVGHKGSWQEARALVSAAARTYSYVERRRNGG